MTQTCCFNIVDVWISQTHGIIDEDRSDSIINISLLSNTLDALSVTKIDLMLAIKQAYLRI